MLYNPFVKNLEQQGNSQIDLTEIDTRFAEVNSKLDQILLLLQNVPGGNLAITEIPINPTYLHTGNWDTQLTNLSYIVDGNNSSYTSFGQIAGGAAGDYGFFEITLGTIINTSYSVIEFLIAIQNSNGQYSYWGLDGLQNSNWENVWGIHQQAPHPTTNTSTQIFKRIVLEGSWQKIRFNLRHTGSWAPRIAIASLKVYTIT